MPYWKTEINGSSRYKSMHLINFRHRIAAEYERPGMETGKNIIKKTNTERISKDIWTSIKLIIGQIKSEYSNESSNVEVYEDDRKLEIYRKYWRVIFNISEQENILFYHQKDELEKLI